MAQADPLAEPPAPDAAPAPPFVPPPRRGRPRGRALALTLLALAGVAATVWGLRLRTAAQSRRGAAARETSEGQDRPVPVLVATVARRDVPLYLEGLGTVAAYNTVTVRTRVDGRLDAVLFREGETVHRGQLLAQLDPQPYALQLRQAEAVVARDAAQVRSARRALARLRALRGRDLVAQQDLDAAVGALEQAEATLHADAAQVDAARLTLSYTRITSPIEGVTGLRLVDAGNLVRVGDATGLVVVAQVDPIAVLFTLPQDDLPRVAAQMALGALTVDVFSRDGDTHLGTGRLTVLDNQINQATASLRLKAVFDNPARALWPEQFVKTRLLLSTRRGALVVPAAAVQRGPAGAFVYVVGDDGRVAMRPLHVDRTEGDVALVADGVAAGEQVVTEGQGRLRAGARVTPRTLPPEGRREGRGREGP